MSLSNAAQRAAGIVLLLMAGDPALAHPATA